MRLNTQTLRFRRKEDHMSIQNKGNKGRELLFTKYNSGCKRAKFVVKICPHGESCAKFDLLKGTCLIWNQIETKSDPFRLKFSRQWQFYWSLNSKVILKVLWCNLYLRLFWSSTVVFIHVFKIPRYKTVCCTGKNT